MADIHDRILSRELKKGSAELIVLSIVEARPRHGYEISKLIELRSGGEIKFHVALPGTLRIRRMRSVSAAEAGAAAACAWALPAPARPSNGAAASTAAKPPSPALSKARRPMVFA
jgi:hypothetical protein